MAFRKTTSSPSPTPAALGGHGGVHQTAERHDLFSVGLLQGPLPTLYRGGIPEVTDASTLGPSSPLRLSSGALQRKLISTACI